jgi:hypothetical protein
VKPESLKLGRKRLHAIIQCLVDINMKAKKKVYRQGPAEMASALFGFGVLIEFFFTDDGFLIS